MPRKRARSHKRHHVNKVVGRKRYAKRRTLKSDPMSDEQRQKLRLAVEAAGLTNTPSK